MKNIEEFWKECIKIWGPQIIKENYDKYCKNFNLIKCQKIGINGDNRYEDILYLLDHLFVFENINNEKYYISNTYMTEEEIIETLIKYNLVGKAFILGTGFWNKNTTAIMFDYDSIEKIKKNIIEVKNEK